MRISKSQGDKKLAELMVPNTWCLLEAIDSLRKLVHIR